MRTPTVLTGRRYGRLRVASKDLERSGKHTYWICECDCGVKKSICSSNLTSGRTKSCGCLLALNGRYTKTHGLSKSREYQVWHGMFARCENPKSKSFQNYGGRGISVCERWQRFENFLKDMGRAPTGKSIDRIDNDGDYSPESCRWATRKQQSQNRRMRKTLTLHGETKRLFEWSAERKIKYSTLRSRLSAGWNIEKALTQTVRPSGRDV